MKISDQYERYVGASKFSISLCNGVVHSWLGVDRPGVPHPNWATAERVVREEYKSLHPDDQPKMELRRWIWRHEVPGDLRFLAVRWFPLRDANNIVWNVSLDRIAGNMSEHSPYASYSSADIAPTWEEGIEAGRKMLDALVALPFPNTAGTR